MQDNIWRRDLVPPPVKLSASPGVTAAGRAISGSHRSTSYQTALHICRSKKSVKTNITPWQPPATALQMEAALCCVAQRAFPSPPQQQIAFWYLLLLMIKKMTCDIFWIRMTKDFPANSTFKYIQVSSQNGTIQVWFLWPLPQAINFRQKTGWGRLS